MQRLHPSHLELDPVEPQRAWCDQDFLPPRAFGVRAEGRQVVVDFGGPLHRCSQLRVEGGAHLVIAGRRDEVRSYGGTLTLTGEGTELRVIDELPIEDYVAGVVDAESETHQPAALEAQAVVSRTYAAHAEHRHSADYDLCDLAHCQLFRGAPVRAKAAAATEATAGQVLVGSTGLLHGYFHSACGGQTASAAAVLGDVPDSAEQGVSDLDEHGRPWCAASTHSAWSYRVAAKRLAEVLEAPSPQEGLRILERDPAGTVLRVRAFGINLSGEAFQSRVNRVLGWQSIQSTWFEVEERHGELAFRGRGLGHRVGLCQFGADGMATAGRSSAQILEHYFPGSHLESIDRVGVKILP